MGLDGGVEAGARQRGQRGDCGDTVGFTSCPLASEPIPLWCELLNELTRKRNVAAPTLPNRKRSTGKFGRAIICIFKEPEAPLLGTIEPEDNSFAECGRLVFVSEFHPPLEVAKVRRGDVLDHRPGRFEGSTYPAARGPASKSSRSSMSAWKTLLAISRNDTVASSALAPAWHRE